MNLAWIFAAINRQKIEDEMQEAQLALYSDFDFVYHLKPILKRLSETTGRTYRSYLMEAQEMVLQGDSTQSIYAYFFVKLSEARLGM